MSEGELQKRPEEMAQSDLVRNSLDSVSLYFDMLDKVNQIEFQFVFLIDFKFLC